MSLYGVTGHDRAAYREIEALGHRGALLARLRREREELRSRPPEPKPIRPPTPVAEMPKHESWFWPIVEPAKRLTVRDVQIAVARHFAVGHADILSSRRTADIARIRQIAMYLVRQILPHVSLSEIGRRFGGRDHTTALHAVRKIGALAAKDKRLVKDLSEIKARLCCEVAQP